MNVSKLRRRIAWEAARLMYWRHESEYYRAKLKAARQLHQGVLRPADLPSNTEIRDQIQALARTHEGQQRTADLCQMRIEALRVMRILERFRPRLIGSVLTGHIRQGSDIDLHVFSNSVEAVTMTLDEEAFVFDVERKLVRKHGEERSFTHIHIKDRFPIELTVYPVEKLSYVFKSSITGKAMERATIAELSKLVAEEYPHLDLDSAVEEAAETPDRFRVYESLLLPLEHVKESPRVHPEGDALYHSLQVFDLARDELPYDEEFLLAALLHDVGKAIDRREHVAAALEALDGYITDRTRWLIEFHMVAQSIRDGTAGARAKRRLQQSESYDELILLSRCDTAGRKIGVPAPDVDEALDYVRGLAIQFG